MDFVRHDGKPPGHGGTTVGVLRLASLRDRYLQTHAGALEENTLYTARIHFQHLVSTLGEDMALGGLAQADLQRHVDRRVKSVSPYTARKEVNALRTAWNWARRAGLIGAPYPNSGLVYPKAEEPPPFQTRAEINRQVARGGLTKAEVRTLWKSIYLQADEVASLLVYAKDHAGHPWVYPLVCTAAHTGARRGELIRMRTGDVDLESGSLVIRERKRVKGTRTTRRAPLSLALAEALREWLGVHPGGRSLFCQADEVARSKKRSPTTGHRNGPERPTTAKGRSETVRARDSAGAIVPLTVGECNHHFKQTFADSEWSVVSGLHVLRHSFASCMAAAGVDQRIIDDIMGHTSEAMKRRYRHLAPSLKGQAVRDVFG